MEDDSLVGEALEDEDGISCELTVKVSCKHLNEANLYICCSEHP